MADGIIGSVGVSVVPDASSFFRDFIAKTSGQADSAGRELGKRIRHGIDEELARPVKVKVNADTAKARAEIAAMSKDTSKSLNQSAGQANLLRDAIIALGPAAIPIGAVMVGAMAGALPAAAALALGIKGIADEMKAGTLVGTRYGRDLASLQVEAGKLKTIAAGGLLSGIDRALQHSSPLFRTLNGDIGGMSAQLGSIIGHAGPALVAILHDLNPLFVTFGNELAKGAQTLEHFATSGTGLESFVSYAQAELPVVEHALGQLIELIVHLGEGLAPLGHVALTALGDIASALNAIPIDVLSKLESGAVAAYLAFRAYGIITGIVKTVTGAVESLSAKQAASAAVVQASLLAQQATQASAAAEFAAAEAAKATAAAEAATEIAAALEGSGSILAAQATSAAEDAIIFAAAMQAEADAAALSATEIATAAAAAAESVTTSGEAASLGWAGLLGPIGAVVVGVGILGAAMLGSGSDAKQAAADQNSYANSVNKTTDALSAANIAQTNKNLSDQGALSTLDQLHASGDALGVTYAQLTAAINGPAASLDKLKANLEAVAAAHAHLTTVTVRGETVASAKVYDDEGKAAISLLGKITSLRSGLLKQIKTQQDLNALERATSQAQDGGSAAAQRQAASLHLGAKAFLDAETAARKATASTRANIAAMQAENDAAGLLKAALDRLNGVTLDISDARINAATGLATLNKGLKKNADAWKLTTNAGRTNQQNLNAQLRSIQAVGEAISGGTKLTIAGKHAILDQLGALKQDLIAHNASANAIHRVSDEMRRLAGIKIPPTKLDVDKTQVDAKVAAIQREITAIRQGKLPGIDADTRRGKATIAALQAKIDFLRQTHKPALDVLSTAALDHIATVQNSLNNLHDKTVVVTLRTVGSLQGAYHAQAAGTRATFGTPYVPPNTVSTVGEAGYEGLITDSMGRASILSNAQAKAAGIRPGASVGGFAHGTLRNERAIAAFLAAQGLSRAQIAGVLGNWSVETGGTFNPSIPNPGEGAIGLAQWEGSRRTALDAFARRRHSSEKDLSTQLAFFWHELKQRGQLSGLLGEHSARGAARFIQSQFEVSSSASLGEREARAAAFARTLRAGGLGDMSVGAITTGKIKGQKVWYFDGHAYSTYTAALNAQVAAQKVGTTKLKAQLHSLSVAGGADMRSLGHSVTGTAQDVHAAFKQLFGDLRAGGVTGEALDRLKTLDTRLAGEVQQRHRIVTQLAAVVQRQKAFESSVSSAVVGGFDVTTAGVNRAGAVTGGSLFAQAKQDANREKRTARDLLALQKRGLNRADLVALAGQGAAALPQLEALLGMGQGQFSAYNRTERRVAALGDRLGNRLGKDLFGGRISELRADRRAEEKAINKTAERIGDAVDRLEHFFSHGGLTAKIDDRGLLRLVRTAERKADRRGGIPGGRRP